MSELEREGLVGGGEGQRPLGAHSSLSLSAVFQTNLALRESSMTHSKFSNDLLFESSFDGFGPVQKKIKVPGRKSMEKKGIFFLPETS